MQESSGRGPSGKYPLSRLRVLDLTSFVSGPFCTQLLADLGADVVKIERPPEGDSYRKAGPHFLDGQSSLFLSLNRNKKSVALNLKSEEGKRVFLERLVPNFDVVLENFSLGTRESLGIGYEECNRRNPRLVYCSITGFGEVGPYRGKKGFDLIIQAMSGIMDLTGEENSGPVKVGVPITDFAAGLFAAVGILSACYERDTLTGMGKKVSTSLYEGSISLLSLLACDYFVSGDIPRRMGSASPSFAPYQAFKTKDGYVSVAGAGTEDIWLRFVKAIENPELASDPKFSMNAERVKNRKILEGIINEKLSTKNLADWLDVFEKYDVPCGPVNSLAAVLADPHINALGMLVSTPLPNDPSARSFKSVRTPVNMDGSEETRRNEPPPLLGEDTDRVLLSVGLDEEEISTLRKRGVII